MSTFLQVTTNKAKMVLQPLRLNWHYVIWYKNVATLLASLVVPFSLLAYWNIQTFRTLLRRRYFRTPTSASSSMIQPPISNTIPAAAVVALSNSNMLKVPSNRDGKKSTEGTNSTFYLYFWNSNITHYSKLLS